MEGFSGKPEKRVIPLAEERRKRGLPEVAPELPQSYDIVAQNVLAESKWRHEQSLNLDERIKVVNALAQAKTALDTEILERLRVAQLYPVADDLDTFAIAKEYMERVTVLTLVQ